MIEQLQLAVLEQEHALIRQLLLQIPVGETIAATGIREVERAVRSKHQIVRAIQTLTFVGFGENRPLPIFLQPHDGAIGFCRIDDSSLRIERNAVGAESRVRGTAGRPGPVRLLEERGHLPVRCPPLNHVGRNIADQQMAAARLFDPQDSIDESEAVLQRLDGCARRDDGVEGGFHTPRRFRLRRLRAQRKEYRSTDESGTADDEDFHGEPRHYSISDSMAGAEPSAPVEGVDRSRSS